MCILQEVYSPALRQQLLRDGFAILPRFYQGHDLQALQYEAELALEAAGAYDTAVDSDSDLGYGDDASESETMAKERGCIFEVARSIPATDISSPGPGMQSPKATELARLPTGEPDPPRASGATEDVPGQSTAAATACAMTSNHLPSQAVPLPGLGLLASPRLQALVRAALGFPSTCTDNNRNSSSNCSHHSSGKRPSSSSSCSSDAKLEGSRPEPTGAVGTAAAAAAAKCATTACAAATVAATASSCGPYLFNEQFIVKPPRSSSRSAFAWHRDSDWCRGHPQYDYSPYISVWTALDDMDEENGALVVLPGSHLGGPGGPTAAPCKAAAGDPDGRQGGGGGSREATTSSSAEAAGAGAGAGAAGSDVSNLEAGFHSARHLFVPAGTVVVFLDTLLHASGPNHSRHMRRAWMPQFSSRPILRRTDGQPVALAMPLTQLQGSQR
ncbi:hypothetical protein Agub_g13543 [Astrephomene gubernaculifera]|uniref:Phytanoyl-CoA dioxygenase n=1 Tax=Astrephomene gubernaculifera TaxID=47775 RepID=A0AAD3E4C5_9CHLO|nr:hypothetical protein Agub_g13543 [Astrephomene gubernaculifera]